MLPDIPALVKCPKCAFLFWIEDAQKLGEIEPCSEERKRYDPINYDYPCWYEYLNFVATHTLSKEQEQYIRVRAWWAMNDSMRMRSNSEDTVKVTDEFNSNLIALRGLLDDSKPEGRLMKAEIARELGHFEECQILLQAKFPTEMRYAVSLIRDLSHQRKTQVAKLIIEE